MFLLVAIVSFLIIGVAIGFLLGFAVYYKR